MALIAIWAGVLANIPSNWALCDGNNGTPDLRSTFIKGAAIGADSGASAGTNTHTHTNHPSLTHAGFSVDPHPALSHFGFAMSSHGQGYYLGNSSGIVPYLGGHTTHNPSDHPAQSHSVTQPDSHAALSHSTENNEPEYYEVAFIMKL